MSSNTKQGIIAWFAQNSVAANLLMVLILIGGFFTVTNLRIEGFPSIEPNTITVDVTYLSGSAKQAEEGIAIKIEEALQGVAGIKEVRSTSSTSGAVVTIQKQSGYNLDVLNDDVKNKVDGIYGFPASAEKAVITKQLFESHALWFDVYGDVDQDTLQAVSRELELEVLRLPAVSKVTKTGWKAPEIAIEVKDSVLQEYELTLDDVVQAVRSESLSETSGELRSSHGLILLKADKQGYRYQDFSTIHVKTNADGSMVYLSDIANIKDGFEETPNILSRFQGKPAINYSVIVDKQADILEIAQQTKALIADWQASDKLPKNVDVAVWWDQSQFMIDRLALLGKNGVIGVLLVMAVLAIFLNLKVAFWVGMGLPICFAGGMILMGENFFNLTLNDLTTFGFIIVLGILVDDSVVVGESIYAERQSNGDTIESTIVGVKRIAVPTLYGVLTTIAAFYPMSYIAGDLGQIFSQFALIAVACLIFSLIGSKLILPAHLSHLNTHKKPSTFPISRAFKALQHKADGLMQYINDKMYQPAIRWSVVNRYKVLSIFLAIFILVVGLIPSGKVNFVFFPDIPRNIIEVKFSSEDGSGYGISHSQITKIENIVTKLNQDWRNTLDLDEDIILQIQSQVLDDKNGHIVMELSDDGNRAVSATEIEQALRQHIGATENLKQLKIITNFETVDAFALKILADDLEQLSFATLQILQELKSTDGVADIQNDLTLGQQQVAFELSEEGRARGLTTAALAKQIQQAFYGAEVQRVQRGKDEVKVRVRYPSEDRKDITNLENARIRTNDGSILPLLAVANLTTEYTRTEIKRINGRLAVTISANIDKSVTSPANVTALLEQSSMKAVLAQYPNTKFIKAGESAEEQKSIDSMLLIFGLSMILIYALVAVPLKSYWQPVIIMSVIPFGIVGAILGHWFNDLSMSILSLNGILALSGVVVNNSLLLVDRFNELRTKGLDFIEAVAGSGSQRLRAIILTSLTTYAGLASLLQEDAEQAQYLIPAAASLAYGILFSTVITLILVPVLLSITEDLKQLWKVIKGQLSSAQANNLNQPNSIK